MTTTTESTLLGEWCFRLQVAFSSPTRAGAATSVAESLGGCPMNVFIGRAGTALGNDLGEWCLTPVS
jgi:hypothetical protein